MIGSAKMIGGLKTTKSREFQVQASRDTRKRGGMASIRLSPASCRSSFSRDSLAGGRRHEETMMSGQDEKPGRILRGECLCRKVKYEVKDAFAYAMNCHCSNCRRATGSAFKPFAGIGMENIRLLADRSAVSTSTPSCRPTFMSRSALWWTIPRSVPRATSSSARRRLGTR
jgi:hypothetical protein